MVKTRKSLWAAGFALLVCILLLIGTTFAWFTDSVSNGGNKIQAGNLSIEATAYDIGTGGLTVDNSNELINGGEGFTFEQTGQNLKTKSTPIISETLWEPGKTSAKLLTVRNDGSLAAKVKVGFDTNDEGLQEALWFDFVQVDSNGNLTGQFEQRPMSGISALGDATELKLNANESVNFVLVYGMYETAGNEYQGKSFSADVNILATQLNSEKDGFGNPNYDINADNTVFHTVNAGTDLGELVNSQDAPVEIDATENLLNQNAFNVTGDVIMNLGLNTINTSDSQISGTNITVKDGGTLTINAEANSYGFTYTAGKLIVDGSDSVLTVNGGRYGDSGYKNSEISARNGGTVYINEGIFSTSGAEGHAVTAEADSTIYINGGSFSTSGANSITIYANGGTIIIENLKSVTANGSRYGVDNGGKILVSMKYSPSAPTTSLASGCSVTDNGDGYWLITKN